MPDSPDKPMVPEVMLPCEVCEKEVPLSEAYIREADDYVMYFCGLECFDHWHKKAEHEQDKD